MKWIKLGKIFDPNSHQLVNNCQSYAQSPQALVFSDFVRVYFSTRELDSKGKYLSHVSFVDFSKDFKTIKRLAQREVISLGGLGSFDEHGIFPFNIYRDGEQIWAYTTGWNRRVSVSTDAAIGLATSQDHGLTFQKVGRGPIMSASLAEPFLVGDAFVRKFDETFHMWYIHGTTWLNSGNTAQPERLYKIAHATSNDGLNWRREGRPIISDKLNPNECQALPSVIQFDGTYHMVFCYREALNFRKNPKRAYRIGSASSKDLRIWVRNDEILGLEGSSHGWDSEMVCYPHLFELDGQILMLYNGNAFGRDGFGLAKLEK